MENIIQSGIYIDGSKATIITFHNGVKHEITEIVSAIENKVHHQGEGEKGAFMGAQHINNERVHEERKNHQIAAYLKKVVEKINTVNEVYIFGPGVTKTHLVNKIKNNEIKGKLKLVEAADKMTLNQKVKKVKEVFNFK